MLTWVKLFSFLIYNKKLYEKERNADHILQSLVSPFELSLKGSNKMSLGLRSRSSKSNDFTSNTKTEGILGEAIIFGDK